MLVPKYWAEGRLQQRLERRQITVRRWGWSDLSQDDAQRHSEQRAREAFDRIVAGTKLPRRERKQAYNGAEGVPIREEIVAQRDAVVITRNVYGALCLNTPNVLFADIDFSEGEPCLVSLVIFGVLFLIGIATGLQQRSIPVGVVAIFVAALVAAPLARLVIAVIHRWGYRAEEVAKRRLDRFLHAHHDWHVRIYRTPAGLRVLVMHRTFEPHEAIVEEFFRAVKVDPIYARMCRNQRCFRARVSPKPWRIDMDEPRRFRSGVWPLEPDRRREQLQWIDRYEHAAHAYAACRFVESQGRATVTEETTKVQRWHDELCQSLTNLPLA